MYSKSSYAYTTLGCLAYTFVLFVLTIIPGLIFLAAKMFEFTFWFITGKDLPWYLDVLGAIVFNAINFISWFITYLMYVSDVSHPLIGQ